MNNDDYDVTDIDVTELERQRRQAILDSGEYLKLEVLIGVGDDGAHGEKMPVITTEMCQCTYKEVGCLYTALQTFLESYERDYPMECAYSMMTTRAKDHGYRQVETNKDKKKKRKKDED
jgi:hypothetical protein